MYHSRSWLFLIVAIALLAGPESGWAQSSSGSSLVNCLDEATDIIHRTRPGECGGRIITDEAAEETRDRRRDYIKRFLSRPPAFAVPGRRLTNIASGFFVARDGSLLTNYHVVKDCHTVSVSPTSGDVIIAASIVSDPDKDLALIRTDLKPDGVASFAAATESFGPGPVAVVGYPDQGVPPIKPLLTKGEIAPVQGAISPSALITIRADVRRGNSGGPLFDEYGNVIGVIFARINSVSVYEKTGALVRDIGFALPVPAVLPFLERHAVRYETNQAGQQVSWDELLQIAEPYIARIDCWR